MVREPSDYEESGPGMRSFSLNSDYARWVLREEEEPSMLPRLSRREATVAFVAIIVPAAIPWLASLRLPQDARWWDISCNVALFSSLALIATALVGSFAGPLIGLVAYLSAVAVQQTIPAVAMYLPVSGASTNLQAHPVPAAVLAVTACCVWSQTLGRSRLVQRLHRND